MEDSAEISYDMRIGRYLLTDFRLILKFSEHVIMGGNRPFEIWTAPVLNRGTYRFKILMQIILHLKNISYMDT